ncbi:hypothetical protein FNV43_RR14507 [Rhamnella rubrinervis]|uniref:Uncharacterized protein n=1 Tax=Rhamnella rubrinervis TaxID=2594499 RepID=A0A8K0MFS8_9ROSA|nr:hypothetical protein FNV43_RR14507 [Rhamnella rubrinervis]
MEACLFTTSNSFIKTIEFATSIRPRSLNYSKRNNLNHFLSRKVAPPSSVTCCLVEPSSPIDDDNKPLRDADWRSFRAKLVAGEKTSRAEKPSSEVDPDTVVDHPPSITIADKWAHKIHEPEKGCLLIATEKLGGVHIFERTVILVLSTGPLGPSGIILNRPSLMSIKETRSTAPNIAKTFSDRPLFFGGPLEESLFLVSSNGSEENEVVKSGVFEEVMKGVYYGTKESLGCAAEMVKRNMVGIGDFRFFDGYCGWEKEQLKDEIAAGYSSVGLWEEVLGLVGPKKVW